MKKLSTTLFINAVALFLVSALFEEVTLDLKSLVIMTIVFTLLNMVVKPILKILAIPLTIITLGLFSLVINGLVLYWAFKIVPGAACDSMFVCILASIVISVVNSVLSKNMKK